MSLPRPSTLKPTRSLARLRRHANRWALSPRPTAAVTREGEAATDQTRRAWPPESTKTCCCRASGKRIRRPSPDKARPASSLSRRQSVGKLGPSFQGLPEVIDAPVDLSLDELPFQVVRRGRHAVDQPYDPGRVMGGVAQEHLVFGRDEIR